MIDKILKPIKLFTSVIIGKPKVSSADDMYSSLSVAKEEVWKRWEDKELAKKVADFMGPKPEVFSDKPKAIIFRNIATPNLEFCLAKEYAQMLGLELVVIEYTSDKFCTRNRDKLHLGKMMFFDKRDKSQAVAKEKVISIKDDDNKCFTELKTAWGEDFISFHHRIFKESGFEDVKFFDASVYQQSGLNAYEIYLRVLSICASGGILLENFLVKADKGEKRFTEEIIVPAFAEIEKKFGVRPLIVPILSADGEGSLCWQYYPESVKQIVNKK